MKHAQGANVPGLKMSASNYNEGKEHSIDSVTSKKYQCYKSAQCVPLG